MTTFNADQIPAYIQTRIDHYQRLIDGHVTHAERVLVQGVIADLQDIRDTLEATE